MLSNQLHNGMETAKLLWSRIPSSEDSEVDGVSMLRTSNGNTSESLDYEVIENHAYRYEQVFSSCFNYHFSLIYFCCFD